MSWLSRDVDDVKRRLIEIQEKVATIERRLGNVATREDLDNAIVTIQTTVQNQGQQISAELTSLQEKIDAGAAPADFQPEVDRLNEINAQLQAIGTAPAPAPTPAPAAPADASTPTTPADGSVPPPPQ